MANGNITFSSNIYPVKDSISSDRDFVGKIYDYTKLKSLRDKYFNYLDCNMLSPIQKKIISEGAICSNAKKDPCWGIEKVNGNLIWSCKCVNNECVNLMKCRSDFEHTEYELFSPDVNNTTELYGYHVTEGQKEFYHEITCGEDEEYRKSDVKPVRKFTEENSNIDIDVLKIATEFEKKQIVNDDEEKIDEDYSDIEDGTKVSGETNQKKMPKNIFSKFVQAEQKDIIKTAVKLNIFVDSGPGTGKTYVLINKINNLVSEYDVDPETIQILSFTNAAVAEIKNRLNEFVKEGGDRGLRNVDIRTFHSLAWWLLGQANVLLTDRGWKPVSLDFENVSYDESIRLATNLIDSFPEIVSGWNHFIVDEVQDLTGNKAEFVIAIINACLKEGCGFSVFGDSCQAIYDYVKKEDPNAITSDEFYNMLYGVVSGNGKFLCLSKNHRQTDSLISLTGDLRTAILDQSRENMYKAVVNMHSGISKLNKSALLLEESDVNEMSKGESLCFLCRKNGQTLRLSTLMRKKQIPHTLNAYDNRDHFAPWVAQVFIDYTNKNMDFEQFGKIIADNNISVNGYSLQDSWERVKKLLHSKSEIIDVAELLQAIRTSKIDDPLFRVVHDEKVTVSNIHRAKGREYERVIVDDSYIRGLESYGNDIGEYKTLYVAVTRPKRHLESCEMNFDNIKNYYNQESKTKRCFITKYGKKTHIEVGTDKDVYKIVYIKGDIEYKLQKFISKNISQGDNIILKRVIKGNSVDYDILHCINDSETIIGNMSNYFINDLKRMLRPKQLLDYPAYIEDLFVDSVYTHIESSSYGAFFPEIRQISKFCVWNWVNFRGLGHLIYDTY